MSLSRYSKVSNGRRVIEPAAKRTAQRPVTAKTAEPRKAPRRSASDPIAQAITTSDLGQAMPQLAQKLAAIPSINLHDAEEIMAAANPRLAAQLVAVVRM